MCPGKGSGLFVCSDHGDRPVHVVVKAMKVFSSHKGEDPGYIDAAGVSRGLIRGDWRGAGVVCQSLTTVMMIWFASLAE